MDTGPGPGPSQLNNNSAMQAPRIVGMPDAASLSEGEQVQDRQTLDSDRQQEEDPGESMVIRRRSTNTQLDKVIYAEFGSLNFAESERELPPRFRLPLMTEVIRQCKLDSRYAAEASQFEEIPDSFLARVVENRFFSVTFMVLTIYALFVPDLEVVLGNKASKVNVSIVTTVVFFLFFIEFVLHTWVKPKYPCRAYFWLDAVALISLLPDTYFLQVMFAGMALVSGRSYWLLRLLRLSRSSKATRLNRLTRIVRVAALMPRLFAFGRKKMDEEMEKMLDKKLYRVFSYLDDDMDGNITVEALSNCIGRLGSLCSGSGTKQSKTLRALSSRLSKSSPPEGLPECPLDLADDEPVVEKPVEKHFEKPIQRLAEKPPEKLAEKPAEKLAEKPGERLGERCGDRPAEKDEDQNNQPEVTNLSSTGRMSTRSISSARTPATLSPVLPRLVDKEDVTFELFLKVIRQEENIRTRLLASCQRQIRRSNNMQNLTSRHSEDVGVKVALGVLLMLLVLTLVEPGISDNSALMGLEHLDTQVKEKFSNQSVEVVPLAVQEHVLVWEQGVTAEPAWDVAYLDLRRQGYCNDFVSWGQPCGEMPSDDPRRWTPRKTLTEIDDFILDSDYRWTDLDILVLPDLSGRDVTQDEKDRLTNTVAVLDVSKTIRQEALMSILTTMLVIIIILLGIVLLTKDLTYLSKSLLKPLRALAEEMQSIVQLQLAGLTTESATAERGTAEIRQIQRIFDNMKKAIKSWGKYVPWPVVQLLLQAGVDAKPGVEEREVTLFFSDIASFTSIVESIPPEDSLLLLSRYFNDMSKVIDDHGGIVIEFIGDAILSVYGAPLKNSDHATAAVRSTLRMLSALGRINEWSAGHGLPEVHIRCGVHTGQVLVGNMGFHSRMKYGVVGENANIPGRLEELNKHYSTEMLISGATYSRLDPEAFIVRPIDYVYLRHAQSQSEPIYQVMARASKTGKVHRLKIPATQHTEAMQCYKSRDFAKAAAMFAQVNESMQEITGVESDTPSVLLMKRCKAYMENPPPPKWDGVWDQASEPS
mmetsp:Transcript_71964/g.166600  ORF Transcript_71964/g.166600 Transcript_71964/m.166600 type:complete len:1042 (+) Transcript_71964:150-3275(+)